MPSEREISFAAARRLDASWPSKENYIMMTTETTDGEAILQSLVTGKPVDPEIAKRIRERAHEITERLRRVHGTMDIAVPLLREIRQ